VDVRLQRSRRGERAAVTVSALELEDTVIAGREGVVVDDMVRVGRQKGMGR
jgi:hypothetical protein